VRLRRPGVAVAACVALLALASCSDDSPSRAVGAAGQSLSRIHSGVMHMTVTMAAGDPTVGFQIDGPFDLTPSGASLPVADLTTKQFGLAPGRDTTHFLSTGQAAFIVQGDVGYQLTDADLAGLRSASDAPLEGIDLTSWVEHPSAPTASTVDGEDVDRITGEVDPVGALNGIVTMAARFGNSGANLNVTDADAPRVRAAVKSSSFEVTTGHTDHLLRTLHATVVFGLPASSTSSSGTNAVLTQLSKLGHLTLTIELRIERPNSPVTVSPPSTVRPISDLPRS
jgi:hypothetical protein